MNETVRATVREARDAYLAANGFSENEYRAKWTKVAFFSLKFAIPNTPAHAWGIRLHDLHHVATGYGTDLVGEGEISAWELAGGLRGLDVYVGAIICAVALTGFVLSPRRVARAWIRGRSARPLWTLGIVRPSDYDALLAASVDELCDRVGARATCPSLADRKAAGALIVRNAVLPRGSEARSPATR